MAPSVSGGTADDPFGFIPYYPLWALIIIALDILVIWAIAAHGGEANLGR